MKKKAIEKLRREAKQILLKRQDRKNLTNKVNSLLNKTFNIFNKVRGDYIVHYDFGPNGDTSVILNENKSLQDVVTIYLFGAKVKHIGQFSKKDGSEIKIRPEYFEQAEKYAKLYEKEYGKEVKISLFP